LQAVKVTVVEPDLWLNSPNSSLRCMKRRLKDSNVYLFFNKGFDIHFRLSYLSQRWATGGAMGPGYRCGFVRRLYAQQRHDVRPVEA
jgi:hypothetical protein